MNEGGKVGRLTDAKRWTRNAPTLVTLAHFGTPNFLRKPVSVIQLWLLEFIWDLELIFCDFPTLAHSKYF
jgi:hypothetical protein